MESSQERVAIELPSEFMDVDISHLALLIGKYVKNLLKFRADLTRYRRHARTSDDT